MPYQTFVFPGALALEHPACGAPQLSSRHGAFDRHCAPARVACSRSSSAFADTTRSATAAPRRRGAIFAVVRDHEAIVDADDATEAATGLAGAERRVEREQARCRLAVVDVAVRAVQVRREPPRRCRVRHRVDVDATTTEFERRLERVDDPAPFCAAEPQAVLDYLERVAAPRVYARVALLGDPSRRGAGSEYADGHDGHVIASSRRPRLRLPLGDDPDRPATQLGGAGELLRRRPNLFRHASRHALHGAADRSPERRDCWVGCI